MGASGRDGDRDCVALQSGSALDRLEAGRPQQVGRAPASRRARHPQRRRVEPDDPSRIDRVGSGPPGGDLLQGRAQLVPRPRQRQRLGRAGHQGGPGRAQPVDRHAVEGRVAPSARQGQGRRHGRERPVIARHAHAPADLPLGGTEAEPDLRVPERPVLALHRRVEEGDRRLGRLAEPFASRGRPPPRRERRRRVGRPGPSKEPDQPLALPVGPDETDRHRGARGGNVPRARPHPDHQHDPGPLLHRRSRNDATRTGRSRPGASMPSPPVSIMDCTNTNGRRMPCRASNPRSSGHASARGRGCEPGLSLPRRSRALDLSRIASSDKLPAPSRGMRDAKAEHPPIARTPHPFLGDRRLRSSPIDRPLSHRRQPGKEAPGMNRRTALFWTMLLGGLVPRSLLAQIAEPPPFQLGTWKNRRSRRPARRARAEGTSGEPQAQSAGDDAPPNIPPEAGPAVEEFRHPEIHEPGPQPE